jgi:hypothetical protein
MARFWHPDRNKEPDAAHRFDAVQKAAEVLRDPRQRAEYDRDFALQVAMSLPSDLRDRRSPGPTADPFHAATPQAKPAHPYMGPAQAGPPHMGPAHAGPAHAGPAHTGPAHTGPAHAGPAHTGHAGPRQAERRRRGRRTARGKALLWAGLAIVVIVVSIVTVVSLRQPASTPAASGNGGAGSAGGTASAPSPGSAGAGDDGTTTLALPEYSVSQDDFPVGNGHVLSIGGPTIALVGGNGQAIWRESASVSSLDGDTAVSGGPQRDSCAVASGDGGHQDDFIALNSGQQTVVPVSGGSFVWEADRVALPDGTIRNPCTGAVVGRAAPAGTFSTAECLIGSTVIGDGRSGQTAWRNGHKLWRIPTSNPVVCDGGGTVVMLDPSTSKISSLNAGNGHTRWSVSDPSCADGCITRAASARLLGTHQTVILTDADAVAALARTNGRVLWQKTNTCALAARADPAPAVLLGSCTSLGAESAVATVVKPTTGTTLSTYPVRVSGCAQGSEWTANTHRLLVACPVTAAASRTDPANSVTW